MSTARPFLGVLILAALGCNNSSSSGPKPMLTGTVYYQNKALTYGNLVFQAADGKRYRSVIKSDGSYGTVRPQPGTYQVGVDTSVVPAGAAGGGKSGGPPKRLTLPERMKDPASSGLSIEITGSSTKQDIVVPEDPASPKAPPQKEPKTEEADPKAEKPKKKDDDSKGESKKRDG